MLYFSGGEFGAPLESEVFLLDAQVDLVNTTSKTIDWINEYGTSKNTNGNIYYNLYK